MRRGQKGAEVTGLEVEQRVGIAWLRGTCGECRWCRSGAENLCPSSLYTGWDSDGGFAEYATVPAGFAYPLPDDVSDRRLAPLLCAGIIGYRSLRRAELPPVDGWASTASDRVRTSPHRSLSHRERRFT